MKKIIVSLLTVAGVALVFGVASRTASAQQAPAPRRTIAQSDTPPAFPLSKIEDLLIEFPLPKGEEKYASIDGKKMHQYVVEQAAISKRYRDAGHPKYWGRIIGSSADAEDAEWLAGKMKALGLSDVHIQPLDLVPQWTPTNWEVTMTSGGKTITLDSAQPAYDANALPSGGVELDAVYVGLGTEADFMGRDVKGKAVFTYSMQGLRNEGAVRRADANGAAVIFDVSMLPGNMRYQAYPSGTKAPSLVLGDNDGIAARTMIAAAKNGPAPKVKVTLDIQHIPNLKTSLVWGTLPGATDETIYITAHKDGWFEAAGDNAGGVASMLGLAGYYAKIPRAQRRRTMVFIGLDGHHNGQGGNVGARWLTENKAKFFSKTALLINDEHPSTIATQSRPRYYPGNEIAWANTYMPIEWYAGGKQRPELQAIAWKAFKEFGVPLELDPSPTPPASDLGSFYRYVPGIDASEFHNYFHTDWETPETVPWTGLEATTRSFAKIIDEVNKLPLSTFQRPEEPAPAPRTPPPPTSAGKQ